VLALGSALSLAPSAQASTPSDYLTEIITPAGWELRSSLGRCTWRDVSTSDELVVPEGWGSYRTSEEPTWGGCVCSDLVVPLEWLRAVR
jgi:hypothetical protein